LQRACESGKVCLSVKENIMPHKTFAMAGTAFVVAQMAMLSFGVITTYVLLVGLSGAICWGIYAAMQRDKWLLITNSVVGCFAAYGLL
jgi:hypothetical protein